MAHCRGNGRGAAAGEASSDAGRGGRGPARSCRPPRSSAHSTPGPLPLPAHTRVEQEVAALHHAGHLVLALNDQPQPLLEQLRELVGAAARGLDTHLAPAAVPRQVQACASGGGGRGSGSGGFRGEAALAGGSEAAGSRASRSACRHAPPHAAALRLASMNATHSSTLAVSNLTKCSLPAWGRRGGASGGYSAEGRQRCRRPHRHSCPPPTGAAPRPQAHLRGWGALRGRARPPLLQWTRGGGGCAPPPPRSF